MALLSAPAAFATEGTAPALAETAEPTKKPSPEKPAGPEDPEEPGEPGPEPTDDETTDESQHPDDDEEEPEPADCPVDKGTGVDLDSELELELTGLPRKVVAGSGWHPFELTATNPTDEAFGEVKWSAAVENDSESDDTKDWLSDYADLQFLDPGTGTWTSLDGDPDGGLAFGVIELGAEESVDIKLRLDISAKAPAGAGYALGLGGYVDSELDCVHNSSTKFPLTILKPGSENKHPGAPKPKKPTKKPSVVTQPQGAAKDLPVTDSLAETGSSSALPAIGLVGGAAVVVGAGAVFVVRRRKTDTADHSAG
ncbi:LAETG motif-containing sortase-dependent surface protein [Streptomyces anatolicus]|nr:LAETG motif-containing sortase-dependent surface protein [Streptomyces anatolicus]